MLWILYSLGAAVFTAVSSLLTKKVLKHEHALEYGAAQGVYSLLLFFALPFVTFTYHWGVYIGLYVLSLILLAGNLYYLKSIRHSELSSAIPLMNISPLFLLVIAFILLGELPTGTALLGVLLLIVGTYLVQLGAAPSKKNFLAPFITLVKSKYALFMIFALFVFSLTATMQKGIVNLGIDAFTIVILTRLFLGINYVILETVKNGAAEIMRDIQKDGKIIFVSSMSSLVSDFFLLMAMAIPGALVSLVIPVKRLSTFITSVFAGTLFHEHNIGIKLLGCFVMLMGVVLVVI